MGLTTDIIFVKALRDDATLMAKLAAKDVYNTTIALPGVDMDNAPLPYVIVTFDGLNNDQTTKDDYESTLDQVTIGVEIAARTRPELGDIARHVRSQIRHYFMNVDIHDEDYDMIPEDYQFSASQVNYDQMKPCYWQVLSYQCDVRNDVIEDENDEQEE